MRVVGCFCPSMPMRTSLTPSAPTECGRLAAAMMVRGRSTTTRAGESRVLSFGATVAARADLDPDVVRALDYVDSIELARGLCAAAATTPIHQQRYEHVSPVAFAFRFSPPAGLARVSFLNLDFGAPGFRLRRPAESL